jgi:hypothetical protein
MPAALTPEQEADAILAMHDGRLAPAMAVVSGQFTVIQGRSQLLLTLATITLTITGFSGPRIAASGPEARWLMGGGLVLVLAGVLVLLAGLRIRWSTQFAGATARDTIAATIRYRNGKTRGYFLHMGLIGAGIALYVGAVIAYLVTGDSALATAASASSTHATSSHAGP